jgi:glucoamylase
MFKQLLSSLAAIALWQGGVVAIPAYGLSDIDRFITKQSDVSIKGMLANIGADGKRAQGAAPGAVVASPSRTDPDCKSDLLPASYVLATGHIMKTTN